MAWPLGRVLSNFRGCANQRVHGVFEQSYCIDSSDWAQPCLYSSANLDQLVLS